MKVFATIAATALTAGAVAANSERTERQLILGGGIVPAGTKTYVAGVRSTADGTSYCGGSLISPIHVLTTTFCTSNPAPSFVSVGSHYVDGKKDGEQIKIVKAQNHTDFNENNHAYDFAVLTLEKPSKFTPVNLPKADDSDIKPGTWSKAMGWGLTNYPNSRVSYEMRGVDLELWNSDKCSEVYMMDKSNMCAGGVAGKDTCGGDTGGPLIKENGDGDQDDVLIGLTGWVGNTCGEEGKPTLYSRVSAAVAWISSITSSTTRPQQ
ncbi:Glucanase inhibitor protein [Phytophthora megakarya]|uniref:Glucanase inhibitor protein n=1 Tax=Phytophthora megakarya TaxID=4795 RepID=A0A225VNS7_9STRA|nr:Glucanase inhibitor protein [Phytophthora megakarya]